MKRLAIPTYDRGMDVGSYRFGFLEAQARRQKCKYKYVNHLESSRQKMVKQILGTFCFTIPKSEGFLRYSDYFPDMPTAHAFSEFLLLDKLVSPLLHPGYAILTVQDGLAHCRNDGENRDASRFMSVKKHRMAVHRTAWNKTNSPKLEVTYATSLSKLLGFPLAFEPHAIPERPENDGYAKNNYERHGSP